MPNSTGEVKSIHVRAYESVRFALPDDTPEKAMTYIPVREVLKDDQLREQVMDRLADTIEEAEHTVYVYEYLVPTFSKVKEKLKEAREAIRT